MSDRAIIILQFLAIVLLGIRIIYMKKKAKMIDEFIRSLITTGKDICFSAKKPENAREYWRAGGYHALNELEKSYNKAMEKLDEIE